MFQYFLSFLLCAIGVIFWATPEAAEAKQSGKLKTFQVAQISKESFDKFQPTTIKLGKGRLEVAILKGEFRLPKRKLFDWLKKSAGAVATYYGQFPVPETRLLIVPADGRGVKSGTTFGFSVPLIRLIVGTDSTEADLRADWKATHEMVHLALPKLPNKHLWLTEGLAVYVEPIARVQAGDLTPEKVWRDFVQEMPKGLPKAGEAGLDGTDSWGRTYWGGAIFCLLVDVEMRKRTDNRLGLQDAMRGLLAAGGTHNESWPITKIMKTSDKVVSLNVLAEFYTKMGKNTYRPNLRELWVQLGVRVSGKRVEFDNDAKLAKLRQAITRGGQ